MNHAGGERPRRQRKAVKVLLDHGADVNSKENLRGTTALMWASAENHPDVVTLLVERGADIDAQSKSEKDKVSNASSPTARVRR